MGYPHHGLKSMERERGVLLESGRRCRIVPRVCPELCNIPFIKERNIVIPVACFTAGRRRGAACTRRRPGARRRAPLPAASVEEGDGAGSDRHALQPLERFEVRPRDPGPGSKPGVVALAELWEKRRVEQHAPRENPLIRNVLDAVLQAT